MKSEMDRDRYSLRNDTEVIFLDDFSIKVEFSG